MLKKCSVLLLTIMFISACFQNPQDESLKKDISEKKSEISDLKYRLSVIKSEHEGCQSKIIGLQTKLGESESKYKDLLAKYNALLNNYKTVINDYNNLCSNYFRLVSLQKSLISSSVARNNLYSDAVEGEVIYEGKSDYFIVKTSMYYVLLELYDAAWLSKGDIVVGDLHSYGFKDILKDGEDSIHVYIENYWSNIGRCFEWLREHDKLK